MAQYATDFSDLATGSGVPTGFSDVGGAGAAFAVVEDGTATGGKRLTVTPAGFENATLQWNVPGSDGILDQIIRVRADTSFGDIAFAFFGCFALRGSYANYYKAYELSGTTLEIARSVSGSGTQLGTASMTVGDSEWVYIRLRVESGSPNVIKAHASLDLADMGEGASAPGAGWMLDLTDSGLGTGASTPGVGGDVAPISVDRWAVATAGDFPTFTPSGGGGGDAVPSKMRSYRNRRVA